MNSGDKVKQPSDEGDKARSFLSTVCRRLFDPVSIAPLVYFRVIFGLLCSYLMYLHHINDMIKQYYVDPKFHFTYYGFDWVKPWPDNGMYWHFAVLGLLGIFIAIGFCYRASAFLFGLGYTYVFLLDQARFLNHYYLLFMLAFMMAAVPAHRAYSVDVWLRPQLKSLKTPAWTVWLFMFQFAVVYFFAGVAKLNADWLSGATMSYKMWHRVDTPLVGPFLQEKWMILGLTYCGMIYDLVVAPMLLFRKTRWIALIASSVFHFTNVHMFNIDIFPWLMIGATFVLFFSDLLPFPRQAPTKKKTKDETPDDAGASFVWSSGRKLVVAVLTIFVAVQLLLPLRPFIYSGNSLWTDAGHNFSWRMLLRNKFGQMPKFTLSFVDNGKKVETVMQLPTDPFKSEERKRHFWANHWQFRKMVISPDMIWQFCDWNVQFLKEQGFKEIEIHAYVPVTLNGRPYQYLIDPNVNMAAVPRTAFGPSPWVLPLEERVAKPMWEKDDGRL